MDGSQPFAPIATVARLQGAPRTFLRQLGYVPSDWCGERTVKAFLHDNCWHCDECGDWYRSDADMAEEEDQPEVGRVCWFCRWGIRKPGEMAVVPLVRVG
jgi:hypothetical protein